MAKNSSNASINSVNIVDGFGFFIWANATHNNCAIKSEQKKTTSRADAVETIVTISVCNEIAVTVKRLVRMLNKTCNMSLALAHHPFAIRHTGCPFCAIF